MKRVFTLLAALLLTCGLSWAQQITWSAADQGYENGQAIESIDFDDYVSAEFFKGTNNNAPKYYTTGAAIRCYGGNYFTVTSDYLLTEIVLGFASGEGTNAITTDCGDYSNGTWTGSANEVTFSIGGTSGHRRIATFEITYTEGGTPAPSITASNVEIDYDAVGGEIAYTINNPVTGTSLTAETESEWLGGLAVGTASVTFNCDPNQGAERTATVTLIYGNVTKNVTVTQAANPNGPGSENNPYTVAQAIEAIDNGTGTQSVYATGIVSEITTAYNSSYGNISFNMVDEEGDEAFLQAYRCGGDLASEVAVGDVAVVYGNLTYFQGQGIYEFSQGCEVISLTHPVITDPYIQIPEQDEFAYSGGEAEEEITYGNFQGTPEFDVVFCDVDGITTADPEWVFAFAQYYDSETSESYSLIINCDPNEGASRTAYLYVTDGTVQSNVMTITQEGNPNVIMTIAEVRAAAVGSTVRTQGIITSCVGTTAYMQDDNAAICVYGTELIVGYEYIVEGLLANYNGLVEIKDLTDYQMVTEGNDITPEVMTIAFINADYTSDNAYQGWLVRIEEATVTAISGQNVTIAQTDATSAEPATITVRFANTSDITFGVNDIVSLTGNIGCYNGPQIANPSDIEVQEDTTPVIDIDQEEVTVDWDFGECNTINYEIIHPVEGVELEITADVDWIEIGYIEDNSFCFVVETNTGSSNRVGIITLSYEGAENVTVTVTQGYELVPGNWELVDLEDLEEGDVFVIVGTTADGASYAMANDKGTTAAPTAVPVTVYANTLAGVVPDNVLWNISGTPNGYTFYPNATTEKWLYCTNANNGVRVGVNADNNIFTVAEGYLFNNATERYVGVYVDNPDWRCYTSINNNIAGQTFAFYRNPNYINVTEDMVVNNPDPDAIYHVYDGAVLTLNGNIPEDWDASHVIIEAGGELIHNNEVPVTMYYPMLPFHNSTGKADYIDYYLISIPVYDKLAHEANPSEWTYSVSTEFADGVYDLYKFDESADQEWINYKAGEFNVFNLGKGYLYATGTSRVPTIAGASFPTNQNFTVTLAKTSGKPLAGFNLVGSPYTAATFIAETDKAFYVLNAAGTEVIKETETTKIKPWQGIFVQADENEETLTFTTTEPTSKSAALNINLSQNSNLVDAASICFDSNRSLEKFQLNPNHTKIFFTEAGKDFAEISTNGNEMPLSFKAERDGAYTLSFNTKNIEMNYLHLIDNMTGADIDLLANPSYSFEAKATDYASRFRLVFNAGSADNNSDFAFISNGNIIVNGEGTLQVIDITGRVISTEQINGFSSVTVKAAGVYMLQLTNGNEVKTQKIVVR